MVVTVTTEVPKIVSSVVKFFEELPGNIWTAILKALDVISKWRERMVAFVVIEIPKIVSSIVGEFKKLPDELRKLGKFIWDGLINGLKDAWSTVTNGIKNFTDGFVNGFKDALEIHSPSQVFHQIGVYVVQGLANGIIGSLGYVNDAMNKLVDPPSSRAKRWRTMALTAAQATSTESFPGWIPSGPNSITTSRPTSSAQCRPSFRLRRVATGKRSALLLLLPSGELWAMSSVNTSSPLQAICLAD